ncbi:MAG: type II secretion system F family protein [Nanoarchaeota archaeon]
MIKSNLLIKVKESIESELTRADLKISIKKLTIQGSLATFILSFIIILFFRNNLKLASNFTIALIQYYFISLLIALIIVIFFIYSRITLKKIKRKKEIENVLSDYLQLVATNLNAGMPIDQAMWYAVRERYGILAQEVEIVARKVAGGIDLEQALLEFADKYDSELLKRSMILLIEGLRSGGELSSLVDKISWNVKETQILEKEISAEVTTYVIFITAAAIFIAPFLYALSHRIIIIMADILSKIDVESLAGLSSNVPLKFSGGNIISPSDFKTFIFINLGIGSVFASMIVSLIRKGNIKSGLRLIPVFLITSIVLFLLASIILTNVFKGIVL